MNFQSFAGLLLYNGRKVFYSYEVQVKDTTGVFTTIFSLSNLNYTDYHFADFLILWKNAIGYLQQKKMATTRKVTVMNYACHMCQQFGYPMPFTKS